MKAAHHKQLSVSHIFVTFSKMWNVVKNFNHEILKTFKNNWQLIFLETTRCLCKEVKNENKILCDMLRVPIFKQQFNHKKCQWTQLKERISCWLTEAVSQTNTLWFATVKVRRMSSIQEGRPSTIQLPNLMVWQKDFNKNPWHHAVTSWHFCSKYHIESFGAMNWYHLINTLQRTLVDQLDFQWNPI